MKKCSICNSNMREKMYRQRDICRVCYVKDRRQKVYDAIYDIVGYSCWACGYDRGAKGKSILHFHHFCPSKKKFVIGKNAVTKQWDKVWREIRKCSLLCANCHGEIHAGIISEERMGEIYIAKWNEIKAKWNSYKNFVNVYADQKEYCCVCQFCNKEFKVYRKKEFDKRKYCSLKCRSQHRAIVPISKKQLVEDIGELKNWTAVARKYELSDTTIKKWAKGYEILYLSSRVRAN